MDPTEPLSARSSSVVEDMSSAGDAVPVTNVGDAVETASTTTSLPPTETDSSAAAQTAAQSVSIEAAAPVARGEAPEPERKRGRADGPLPAGASVRSLFSRRLALTHLAILLGRTDAFGEAHGRPHTERTRKKRDIYGDHALDTVPRPEQFGTAGQSIRLYVRPS